MEWKNVVKDESLGHELNKVTTTVTNIDGSISPLSIQFNEHSKQPHPVLVRFSRAID